MTLVQALRALRARGYTHVMAPPADGAEDYVSTIDDALSSAFLHDESFVLLGDSIVRPWGDEGMADVFWVAVPVPPSKSRPTVWDRLLGDDGGAP
jgi:hypothetical protein